MFLGKNEVIFPFPGIKQTQWWHVLKYVQLTVLYSYYKRVKMANVSKQCPHAMSAFQGPSRSLLFTVLLKILLTTKVRHTWQLKPLLNIFKQKRFHSYYA